MQDKKDQIQETTYDEYPRSSDGSSQDGPIQPKFTPKEERRIKMKMDLRLVVLVGFMYCISLMDRTNLANAKQAGLVALALETWQASSADFLKYGIPKRRGT